MSTHPRLPPSPELSNKHSGAGYEDVVAIHEVAARFYREHLAVSWAPAYLAQRGFGPAVQQRWHVGYAPAGRRALTRHLRAAGYRDALIVAAGLARRSRYGELSDGFRDRVMFPIRSPGGAVIGFIGRAGENADPAVPRYLNSPATVLYDKGQALFGLCEARPALAQGAVPVVVEGPLDVMAVVTAGHGGCAPVAPCGTALTDCQVTALSQVASLDATGVLVAFDSDQAGQRASVSAYWLLLPHTDRINVVAFPAGRDPAQILHDHGPRALADMLARCVFPLADRVIDAQVARWERGLRFAEGRVAALRAISPVVAGLAPRDVPRQVARLAGRLELDHATVTEAVTDELTRLIQAESDAGLGRRRQGELPGIWPEAVRTSPQDSAPRLFSGSAQPATLAHRRTPAMADHRLLRGSRVPS
jgi:DNA primase catalytic core